MPAEERDAGLRELPGTGGGERAGGSRGQVRVVVYQAAYDDEQLAAVRAAYHQVSERLAKVPGMLGNELLRSPADPTALAVMSRWESREAFLAWEAGADHRQDTAPLRPYRDTRTTAPFAVYEVDAAY